jgi:hypothetical protein
VTVKCPNDHQLNLITEDLARWEPWGRPPTPCKPPPPPSRGGPSGGWGGAHTLPAPTLPQEFSWLAIPETCPPGEGTVSPRGGVLLPL